MYFKSCPRCSGDQCPEKDQYGSYIICLTCGYVAYPDEETESETFPPEDRVAVNAPTNGLVLRIQRGPEDAVP